MMSSCCRVSSSSTGRHRKQCHSSVSSAVICASASAPMLRSMQVSQKEAVHCLLSQHTSLPSPPHHRQDSSLPSSPMTLHALSDFSKQLGQSSTASSRWLKACPFTSMHSRQPVHSNSYGHSQLVRHDVKTHTPPRLAAGQLQRTPPWLQQRAHACTRHTHSTVTHAPISLNWSPCSPVLLPHLVCRRRVRHFHCPSYPCGYPCFQGKRELLTPMRSSLDLQFWRPLTCGFKQTVENRERRFIVTAGVKVPDNANVGLYVKRRFLHH